MLVFSSITKLRLQSLTLSKKPPRSDAESVSFDSPARNTSSHVKQQLPTDDAVVEPKRCRAAATDREENDENLILPWRAGDGDGEMEGIDARGRWWWKWSLLILVPLQQQMVVIPLLIPIFQFVEQH